MAGKKKEASLQASVMNQEQWEEMLTTKGLTVVDVYQQWCGPCRAVVSLLRKIKNELSDDLLHFATAEADSIDALEKYRGKCEPTFLFFGGGELVAVLRGANAPMLQRMIVEELAKEKLVMEQGSGRKVVKDFGLLDEEKREEKELQQPQNEESVIVPASKSYTVAIIKPDAVAHGKANEIIMKIQDAGFEILAHEERTLTETEARDFYQHKAAEACFEDLVQFMSSGPSHILVLSQIEGTANIIPAWREFIGPADIEEARREKPESIAGKDPSSGSGVGTEQHILACLIRHTQTLCFSLVEHQPSIHLVLSSSSPHPTSCSLRAQYSTETLFNAVHGSADSDQASRELAFFFPNFRTASDAEQDGEEERVERTLALIRPDVARENRDEILAQIHKSGFTVALQKEVMLTEEQVKQFYFQHVDEDYFPALMRNMTSGPVLALALARKGAVHHWKNILGPPDLHKAKEEDPECLRAKFAVENEPINQLHGSANPAEAERELNFFFPQQRTLAVIKPDALEEHRDTILEEIRGRGFTVAQLKETVLSREMAEEFYKEHREKPFFTQLVDFMCRGPCMMLILTKENAVEEWQAMMGPSDPEKAREISPRSLRARFAADILHNSVHGSSNEQHAEEKIRFVFGDISADAAPTADSETSRTTSAEWPGGSGDENKEISRSTTEDTSNI
ncbi:PREDICTED: thioredoxin domain-containing protein 3 homolog isoform X1 [Poecilia mexicana]|uniref:thioredoxin domain-containing protein 3 homolog isoform X1 n=1 Tax=Poecilia mexicana TaxID=48701 RepID=UPI00072DBF6F|nr:PREDICTED: thioredoxin domain-containing protein 3 homolog isoform X1 [Poecilia mexicana]XP_014859260.1 PREDICTED: thioredoxin domain-containing protein 3 homolog isoform X1 [Poecilia mexicana]